MKILITGADGFIGSHLTEALVLGGHDVKALCQYNSFGSLGWLDYSPVQTQIEIVCGDIRDPFFCRHITQGIDCVVHLAALIAIPYSYKSPNSYIETNVIGTQNILQASLDAGVNRVIHTSTSEVYGTARFVPINEDHPIQAQSPYSASKVAADALAMSYYSSFGLPVITARPFNTYGPRQSARAVIPTIITQIASGLKEIYLGDVSPTRDFNYVSDTCKGFECLINSESKNLSGEVFNIGSNCEISILGALNLIKELMDKDVEFKFDVSRMRPENSEVKRLWCDNKKIRTVVGFKPKYSLRSGLQKTIRWFIEPENLTMYKADIYNI
jgi:NAD dependent epimerase/dehydratase